MATLDNIPVDPFDMYPSDNPPLFDDYAFIVIGESDELASAPDALGDLWDLLKCTNKNLVISNVILEESPMKFNQLSVPFKAKYPNSDIEKCFVSRPSVGRLKEQPTKKTFENDGVASYPGIKWRVRHDDEWSLSDRSIASFAKWMGLVKSDQ